MNMKISILPDGTRMQTFKPYVDQSQYKANIMVVTSTFGCQRGVVEYGHKRDGMDEVWLRIHVALVRSVCAFKLINTNSVTHITDKNMVISDVPIRIHEWTSKPQKRNGFRRFISSRAKTGVSLGAG